MVRQNAVRKACGHSVFTTRWDYAVGNAAGKFCWCDPGMSHPVLLDPLHVKSSRRSHTVQLAALAQAYPMTDASGNLAVVNEFGQPVGFSLKNWNPPPFPPHKTLTGQYCQLEPLKASHTQDLWEAQSEDANGARWTYMPYGPFANFDEFQKWVANGAHAQDPQFYAIVVDGQAVGFISYLRIDPSHGAIEIGHVYYSLRLAKTRAATEAIYLLASNAFQLGYRRLEWKCDSCNLPSRNAAARYGFTYEGLFRQAIVYKGRTRDTTWFSIIDGDWNGGLKNAFERWLEPSNFDEDGQQKLKLSELTAFFVHARP